MTPEEAYEEALRRIRKAEETGALELDLGELRTLNRLPPELERLTSLQSLDLAGCFELSGNLSPLAHLTSLQSLNLSGCAQLSGSANLRHNLGNLERLKVRVPPISEQQRIVAELDSLQAEAGAFLLIRRFLERDP